MAVAPNHSPVVRVNDAFTVRTGPVPLVLGYLVLGLLWIVASDALLAAIIDDAASITAVQTSKGFAFVAATALFMYFLLRRDFAVLHRAEDELVNANRQLEHVAAFPRLSPNIILEIGPEASITYANDAAHRCVEQLGLTNVAELLPPDAASTVHSIDPGHPGIRDLDHSVAGRVLRWDFFPSDREGHVFAYAADVTSEEVARARLVQSEKLDALGKLAAGIAHDFNNAMTGIRAYTSALLEDVTPGTSFHDDLVEIQGSTDRASDVARRMLDLGRTEARAATRIDLNAEIAELSRLLRHLLPRRAQFNVDPADEALPVDIDPGQLSRVLANLLVNAGDAIGEDGTVTVLVQRVADGVVPEAHVTVQDDGRGMDPATLERVFEPFFTTKGAGSGTGLGLSTCKEIVEAAGGTISVHSALGEGSTFTIALPLAEGGSAGRS